MNVAVDAVVCLLLVSAAVSGLVGVEQSPPATDGRADDVANTLTTTTARVNYSLAPGVRQLNETDIRPDSPELDRTAHGSLAGLLARVATADSGISAADTESTDETPAISPITRTRAEFRRAVRDAVRARTGATVRIDATWRPYPDAPVGGSVSVGPHPPSGAVHTATAVIPTGTEPLPSTATRSFQTLADAVAVRTVSVLVPPGPARVTLRGDAPAAALLRYRYDRLAAVTNTPLSAPLATEDTTAANRRIADALAPKMASDLRNRYDTPDAAADAVSVSAVRIVVRTWRPSAEGR